MLTSVVRPGRCRRLPVARSYAPSSLTWGRRGARLLGARCPAAAPRAPRAPPAPAPRRRARPDPASRCAPVQTRAAKAIAVVITRTAAPRSDPAATPCGRGRGRRRSPTSALKPNATSDDVGRTSIGQPKLRGQALGGDDARAPTPEQAAGERQRQRLDQELQQDVARLGAHRHADADLARPLGDADQHDVHDPDAAHQQRHARRCSPAAASAPRCSPACAPRSRSGSGSRSRRCRRSGCGGDRAAAPPRVRRPRR